MTPPRAGSVERSSAPSAARSLAPLRRELARHGDPVVARGMQAYMKSTMPFHGVHADEVRAIARRWFAGWTFGSPEDWRRTVEDLWSRAGYREEWYALVTLVRAPESRPFQTPSAVRLYGRLVRQAAWWDVVDELAIHAVGPILVQAPNEVGPILRSWSRGRDLWQRRTSIIAQVGARTRTDRDLMADCIGPSLGSSEFFLRKAIGWALRQFARTDPTWVRSYVRAHAAELSPLSRREAMRHLDPPRRAPADGT